MIARYLLLLEKRPIFTKSCTAAFLMGSGDFISQNFEKRESFDAVRTLRVASMGFVVFGPAMHHWYRFLDGMLKNPVAKVVADQSLFAPFAISTFFTWTGVFSGDSLGQLRDKFSREFVPTMLGNYMVWPAAQLINFRFVPGDQRVLFVSTVSLFWNSFLSYRTHRAPPPPEPVSGLPPAAPLVDE